MATRKLKKPAKTINDEKTILDQFLVELNGEIETSEGDTHRTMTKGEALVKTMVNEALKGDQKMLANVLKLVDKLDFLQQAATEDDDEQAKEDWEMLFIFIGKHKKLIDKEIHRLKKANPSYWTDDTAPPKLERAPWYTAVHGKAEDKKK